jgi:myo-inositol-hexaphosphate 3-phosphohydrolase
VDGLAIYTSKPAAGYIRQSDEEAHAYIARRQTEDARFNRGKNMQVRREIDTYESIDGSAIVPLMRRK